MTGGGPGNSTTFLSIDLVKIALGQFDLGPAAAMSIIYFLIILLLSWVFYTVMTLRRGTRCRREQDTADRQPTPAQRRSRPARPMQRASASRFGWLVPTLYIVFLMVPIYWLINM